MNEKQMILIGVLVVIFIAYLVVVNMLDKMCIRDSFGSQPHSMWSDFPMIDLAARRLQKVVVENKDFERLIRQYDRPVSLSLIHILGSGVV